MNVLQRLGHWGDTHHPRWVDLVRIGLGIFLCHKGIEFLQDMSSMMNVLSGSFSFGSFTMLLLGHYIVFAHLLGGVLLVLGMLTRFACLIQLPVLLGAIIFVNAKEGLWQPFSELWLSILVFGLLVYFLIAGNGPWSFDRMSEEPEKKK
jgi:putative oxidoreductase